jgi:hypothetical protein
MKRQGKAGVDFGLTNAKAHWINPKGEELFLSTAQVSRRSLVSVLQHSGILDVCAAGVGTMEGFEAFAQHRARGDEMRAEKLHQARGAILLAERDGAKLAVKQMIVSVGTGTSYVYHDAAAGVYRFPLGNANGAGTVDGKLASFGLASGAAIDELFARGFESFDLTLGEAVPATRGTPVEHYPAAHFAKAVRDPPKDQETCDLRAAGSAIKELVTAIARDVLIWDMIPDWSGATDILVVGTLPSRSKTVRQLLDFTLRSVGKNPIFPTNAEFALAYGAYHDIDIGTTDR